MCTGRHLLTRQLQLARQLTMLCNQQFKGYVRLHKIKGYVRLENKHGSKMRENDCFDMVQYGVALEVVFEVANGQILYNVNQRREIVHVLAVSCETLGCYRCCERCRII